MTMNRKLHEDLTLITMHTAEMGTFDPEDISVKVIENFNSYIGCIHLLCKENLIKDKDFELAEEEKELLKNIHDSINGFMEEAKKALKKEGKKYGIL